MKVTVHLGSLAEPIEKQFPDMDRNVAKILQADADAISRLRVRGIISWAEGDKAYTRLAKQIRKEASKP